MIKKGLMVVLKGGVGLSFITLLLGLSMLITLFSHQQAKLTSVVLSEPQQQLQQSTWHYLLAEPYEHLMNSKAYSIKERRHLLDVKRLINDVKQGLLFTAGLFLVLMLLLVMSKQLSKAFFLQTSTISVMVVVGLGILGMVFFNYFFNHLHTFFFHGGTWVFEETSPLIKLFPYRYFQEFFVIFFLIAGGGSLLFRWLVKSLYRI